MTSVFLSLLFSGIVALSTVVYACLTRRLVRETRLSREFHLEGFMIAYLANTEVSPDLIVLIIKNIGNGVARNVRFRILKDINYSDAIPLADVGVFKKGIPFFAPNTQNRYFILSLNNVDYERIINDYIEMEITFDDEIRKNKKKVFKMEFRDRDDIGKFTPPETYLGLIAYRLEKIEKLIKRVVEQK